MADFTIADLRNAALHEIGVLDLGEAPESEDAQAVDLRCLQKLEELFEDGLIPFDFEQRIPAAYFIPLSRVVAEAIHMAYGVGDRTTLVAANAETAMRRIYKLNQKSDFGTISKATYF